MYRELLINELRLRRNTELRSPPRAASMPVIREPLGIINNMNRRLRHWAELPRGI